MPWCFPFANVYVAAPPIEDMPIQVLLFATARDIAGVSKIEIPIEFPTTVEAIRIASSVIIRNWLALCNDPEWRSTSNTDPTRTRSNRPRKSRSSRL